MNQNPNNPLLQNASPKRTPHQLAAEIVSWVKAGITVTAWLILLVVALGAGYLVIRGMFVALKLALQALGI